MYQFISPFSCYQSKSKLASDINIYVGSTLGDKEGQKHKVSEVIIHPNRVEETKEYDLIVGLDANFNEVVHQLKEKYMHSSKLPNKNLLDLHYAQTKCNWSDTLRDVKYFDKNGTIFICR